jgi:serine phosphatase RsbU (regulator of sigma subunit)
VPFKLKRSLLFALLSAVLWLMCVGLDSTWVEGWTFVKEHEAAAHSFLLSGFTLFCFLFYREEIGGSMQMVDLLDLLWKSFVTSLVAFGLVFVVRLAEIGNSIIPFLSPSAIVFWSYYIYVAAIVIFQANVFYIFKNLSAYPKIRTQLTQWSVVEVVMLFFLLFNVLYLGNENLLKIVCLLVSIVVTLVFALRLKWVGYLHLKQKIQAILLITTVLLMGLFFLQLFLGEEVTHRQPFSVSNSLFFYAQFTFFGVYSLFSLLMLLFNLPTSSLFDQRMGEMGRFQKFSEALRHGTDAKQVIAQLLDGSMAISVADAAWMEYKSKDGKAELFTNNIEKSIFLQLKRKINKSFAELKTSEIVIREASIDFDPDHKEFSLVSFPLFTSNTSFGYIGLLKYTRDGFEKDITNILRTYTQQATISLENITLLSEAIEKERYLEEIKISKRVQQSLLPKYNLSFNNIKISHFSRSTGTVGGDFFDYCTSNGIHYWVAIGDVSGKGTAAAFLMAQLKGIFRSLVQVCSGPRNLVVRANYALSYTTEKNTFVTLSVFLIDTEQHRIRHVRAGHCQAIYYSQKERSVFLLEPKGMGLGMVKDDSFKNYIEEDSFEYQLGDALFLYTDGVTEAKSPNGGMLEVENLLKFSAENAEVDVETILANFESYFNAFCGKIEDDDDVTFMVIKFE